MMDKTTKEALELSRIYRKDSVFNRLCLEVASLFEMRWASKYAWGDMCVKILHTMTKEASAVISPDIYSTTSRDVQERYQKLVAIVVKHVAEYRPVHHFEYMMMDLAEYTGSGYYEYGNDSYDKYLTARDGRLYC